MSTSDLSALSTWLASNKASLRTANGSAQIREGQEAFFSRLISSPTTLADAWNGIISDLEASNAPTNVIESARAVEAEVAKASWSFSKGEHEALVKLDAATRASNSDAERVAVLDQAIAAGAAPRSLLEKMKASIQAPGTVGFRWQACGVCGALGLEGGPVVAAGACIACGLLADM